MFQRIVSAAALAGVLSGLLLTAIQQFEIAPLIRIAEVREDAAIAASPSAHDHSPAAPERRPGRRKRRRERLLATAISNVILATGFALLLISAMARKGITGWRAGLAWGQRATWCFFVAPSLGLPRNCLDRSLRTLRDRELWWAGTVALCPPRDSGSSVFSKKSAVRILGLSPLSRASPDWRSAAGAATRVPFRPPLPTNSCVRRFATNAALWLALGGLSRSFLQSRERGSRDAPALATSNSLRTTDNPGPPSSRRRRRRYWRSCRRRSMPHHVLRVLVTELPLDAQPRAARRS